MSSTPTATPQPAAIPAARDLVRDGFSSRLGVVLATLGSAIGLGNIWKFPALTGLNGGAAFLILYIACTLLVGLPVMISELAIGRRARANAVGSFTKLTPGQPWWLIGAAGVVAAFLILAFYTEVAGWVVAYVAKGATGGLAGSGSAVFENAFGDLIGGPLQSLVVQWVVLAFITVIIIAGVSKGIERVTKRLIPLLFVLLLVVIVRSLTLPNADKGLSFLFSPDFSKVTGATVLAAMGLSFFKLSVGMGTMITYGSYFREDQDIPLTAIRVMLGDLLVSILAGIAIFPAVFAFGFQPTQGASLLFITIPAVFAEVPFGAVFTVLFFVLAGIAATGAMLSILEVPVALLTERFGWSRARSTISMSLLLAVVGATAALSNSTLADVKVFDKTFFDLFDYASSNVLLPIGGLFISVFAGWRWSRGIRDELSNGGTLKNAWLISAFLLIVRFVTPVLVLLVLLNGLGIVKL